MKTTCAYQTRTPSIPLPNAMTRKQMLHKVLDGLLVAASGAGIGAIILLMLAMS